jgi:hypothetical protein
MPSVLFVFSSATPQGWYLPEAAHPYYVLAPHANMNFTSPNGTPLSMNAVCHGLAALVSITDTQGKSVFAGKNVTGFSNVEEEILGMTKVGVTQSVALCTQPF